MSDNDSVNYDLTFGSSSDSSSWDFDSSKSSFVPEDTTGENVVNYYFPVEVVVCGTGGMAPADRETIQAGIFQDLYDAINRRLV